LKSVVINGKLEPVEMRNEEGKFKGRLRYYLMGKITGTS
jgi:hypothetical protein